MILKTQHKYCGTPPTTETGPKLGSVSRGPLVVAVDMEGTDEGRGIPPLEKLRDCLLDRNQPIAKRTHSAFFLRTLGTTEAVNVVGEGDEL